MQSLMSDDFAVRCTACEFTWNTAGMADGLRILGACPKCKGELEFREDRVPAAPAVARVRDADVSAAPHLVLGLPRI
jgi:hypothetical protein